jgi:predicted nucleic acid-binding protein
MKIYIDNCCYNRPFDSFAQARIRAEAVAIRTAVKMCQKFGDVIVGGFMVEDEIHKISNVDKLAKVLGFYKNSVIERVPPDIKIDNRALSLQASGLGWGDSYHLACAETAESDFLLTTDKRSIKANEKSKLSFVKIINPINFLTEAKKWVR